MKNSTNKEQSEKIKTLDSFEVNRLKYVIQLVKEEIEKNDILYRKMFQNTEDEEVIYNMSRTYETKIKNLEKSLLAPYFARIDFKADDKNKKEKIYIGKTNVFDENSDIAVVDWRAPISSIYYDGKIGRTEYKCPEGIIEGELSLKRQYTIEDGTLINYNDIDITTNDQLLQDCLNENSDVRLKNIVATIQSEQNKIIRSNMFKPLIVQGVAGSGKTTVALHRIAYLVYTYEKNFKPEDFLIIAPNRFFLDYISDILPDLGVDYVRQQTFEEFALEILGIKLNVENPNIKLSEIVSKGIEKTELLRNSAKFRSSLDFKYYIDEWLEEYTKNILPKDDFKILGFTVMKYKELQDILNENIKQYSLKQSLQILSNIMQHKVLNKANELIDKITEKRKVKLEKIDNSIELKLQQKIRESIFKESEYEISQLIKGGKKLVIDYIKKIKVENVIELYKKIINNKEKLNKYINEELITYMGENINTKIKKKKIEYEDLSAILYLHYKICGINEKFSLKHIVIDEAQDFGEFQFLVLNEILNNNRSVTILGDIAQGIYSYRGTNNWDRINKIIYDNQASVEILENSYRTTVDIMEEANKVLENIRQKENINLAIPISRHGEKVNYINVANFDEKIKHIEKRILELKNKGFKNIAIIVKDMDGSYNLYNRIDKKELNINLLSENFEKYNGGVTILPSYLSKGLEFDSVIICDFENYDQSTLDIKLLYVAMTRAMHTLDIIRQN